MLPDLKQVDKVTYPVPPLSPEGEATLINSVKIFGKYIHYIETDKGLVQRHYWVHPYLQYGVSLASSTQCRKLLVSARCTPIEMSIAFFGLVINHFLVS